MARIRSISRLIVCVFISLNLLAGGASAATEDERRKIVIALDAISLSLLQPIILATGSEIVYTLTLINAYAIRLPDLSLDELEAIVQSLLSNPLVAGVYDDIVGTAAGATPITMDDISAASSAEGWPWGVDRIGVPKVQEDQPKPNGAGQTVAVLDTGIDCEHPELQENIVSYQGFSAFAAEEPCDDDNGHGTHVAGIIAAAWNQYGIIGVAPKAQLVPVKVLNHNAQAFCSDVIAGIQWVHSKGIRVANMSFGFYKHSVPLKKAIERLYKKGVVMVASAGNCGWGDEGGDGEGDPPDACDNPSQLNMAYPAAYLEVIAVGAITKGDQMAYYSREGDAMDVVAPGGTNASEPILSTAPDGGYALKSGTSMAAAHVTGAVMLALQRKSNLSVAQVLSLLQSTALVLVDPSTGLPYPQERQGAGLINVEEMLKAPPLQ
jgi:subtilisin family serine protease